MDRGGMVFDIERDQRPVLTRNKEVMDRPDKKHVVSIGYFCGNLVSKDIISFFNIRSKCIRILALIQMLPYPSLKIGVLFPFNVQDR